MTYEYKCPTEKGYVKVKMNRKIYNSIFANSPLNWQETAECFFHPKTGSIIFQKLYSVPLVSLMIVTTPITLLLNLANYKEVFKEIYNYTHQHKSGTFVRHHVFPFQVGYQTIAQKLGFEEWAI